MNGCRGGAAAEGASAAAVITAVGQQNMEEMYEVLRFIEHGTHCRQSMDCIRGNLLIRYLKERQGIGKSELFGWFRQLCVCVDQYHRCRSRGSTAI